MCKMKRNTKGNYQKDGAFTEVELERSYTYDNVVQVASSSLNCSNCSTLYRPRGGVTILRKNLTLNGKSVSWTLGSYMRMRHLGPDALQLGIGPAQEVGVKLVFPFLMYMYFFILKVCIDVQSFDLEGKVILLATMAISAFLCVCLVKYGKVMSEAVSLKGISRESLRSKLNIEKIPFQPENHGYSVVCIAEGV